eukprot:GEMP01037616.1.p1 GENE.GEMP01037616.1~~GEMP01037616.1.p1  ORF type:complete len:142 (+),score=31.10 GEMP01037616.1:283-708(+)
MHAGMNNSPNAISPGDRVRVHADVNVIHQASRRVGISVDNDASRSKCAGKNATVIKVDTRDQTAKLQVDGVGEVWFSAQALAKESGEMPNSSIFDNFSFSMDGVTETVTFERGADGKMYRKITRSYNTPNGRRDETRREPI